MSDNSDLLGSDGAARESAGLDEVSKPKRGRPRKAAPAIDIVSQTGVTTTEEDLVPASTEQTTDILAGLAPEAPAAEADPGKLISTPEADGSVSVTLPPVSTEYAAAMANRVQMIGQAPREYAWQRLKRAGKRV